jgi:cobalt-zinc-cadmium efflux system outer membrane protein
METEAAEKALSLARRSLVPNLSLSAFSSLEEGTDDLTGFTIALTVPLFRYQQTDRGMATAERAAAQAELVATVRRLQAEVQSASARFARAASAERRFALEVLRAATENVTLTDQAFAEGEVGLTDVLVLRTAAVAAQIEHLEVQREVYLAWFELAAAVDAAPADISELIKSEN